MARAYAPIGALLLATTVSVAAESPTAAPIARFHQVDAHLYRGGQPEPDGFRYLQRIGVRTVVNLREEEDAVRLREQQLVESLGMRYVNLPVKDGSFFARAGRIPEDAVRAFLQLFDSPDASPVFVHCRRGADRTGAIVGFYRIAKQGWDAARAYEEARRLGMRSWYTGLKRQLLEFGSGVLKRPLAAAGAGAAP